MEDLNESATYSNEKKSPAAFDIDDGKDELNLAEFPLAAIADRVPDGQKTLVFEDRMHDFGKNQLITRRLTISASDKYGLPTSLDDEVIVGLIQLTKQARFSERKVSFSRYQLIQVLGWRHEGRSYERLEKSLMRWMGVTLYYDKAWWDKDEQSWVDESFHILDNVTLYDQERRLKKLRGGSSEKPLSSFTWNEVVFRSFKSGYLKALDLSVFRQLECAAAKRMFRFLDKRFHHKCRWEFDLREFACEHVGLSRNYDTGQLKRRLQPAIEELEAVGFLEPFPTEQRYIKIARGEWRVVFVQKAQAQLVESTPETAGVSKQLVDRGVTPSVASRLVKEYPRELIEKQLAAFDRLQLTKSSTLRNPAGYLVKSIREGYSSKGEANHRKSASEICSPRAAKASEEKKDPFLNEVNAYLRTLTEEEVASLEAEALKRAPSVVADGYYRSKPGGGPAHETYRSMLLEREARRIVVADALKKAS
jgi:hypothetical protein